MKSKIKDLIVLVPGIMGSVLSKNGKDCWNASLPIIAKGIGTFTSYFNQIALEGDDQQIEKLGDGVEPVGLIQDICFLPGYFKITGYNKITRWLVGELECTKGDFSTDELGNYYEFPYDWRRDNRYSARRLQNNINDALHRWRKETNNPKAQVILIGHSMGGLISRYYLEVLGGWRDCKALFTLGTPHRGAVKALDRMVNGVRIELKPPLLSHITNWQPTIALPALDSVLRSLTSAYQLLPNYRVIQQGNDFVSLRNWTHPNLDNEKADAGLDFHKAINNAVKKNQADQDYRDNKYKLIPMLGIGQKVEQSLLGESGKGTIELPGLSDIFWDSDGTVPHISAIPQEYDDEPLYYNEKHASLQSNNALLLQLSASILKMQVNLRGIAQGENNIATMQGKLGFDVADIYLEKQAVTFDFYHESEYDLTKNPVELSLTLTNGGKNKSYSFLMAKNNFQANIGILPTGIYQIALSAKHQQNYSVLKMTDSFVVSEG